MQRGHWELKITMVDDVLPDSEVLEYIADLIVNGYTYGKIGNCNDSYIAIANEDDITIINEYYPEYEGEDN